MLTVLVRISRGLNRGIFFLVSAMGMAMAGIVAVQVLFRYGFNHSLFWSEELARILLVWLTFFGATVAYFHGAHPGVDGLVKRLPPGGRFMAAVVSHLAALALFSIMVWYGASFAWFVRLQITPALGWPKWVIMAAVPAAGVVFWIHGLAMVFGTLTKNREEA
jgi:TRAP-type C4-dicarboxylate transport system permease small subunit